LDAGHGGRDPGTTWNAFREKDAALDFVLELQTFLNDKATVTLTRSVDEYVTLRERCAIANRNDSDIFLSVHLNAVPEEKRDAGIEAVGMEPWIFKGSKKALTIAKHIVERVRSGFKGYNFRRIRETEKLHVLKGTAMPAVLLELGFIDSLHDRSLLQDQEVFERLVPLVGTALLRAAIDLDT
jgi:N-acetylmuramoyl-L-alanine amidase